MANHIVKADGPNIIESMSGLDSVVGAVTGNRIRLWHSDGTYSVLTGSGIDYDPGNPSAATGTVTGLRHFDGSGLLIDVITDFSLSVTMMDYAIYHGFWLYGSLSGDDVVRSPAMTPAIDDTFLTGLGDDVIYAGAGNDYADGSFGNDTLYGQSGDDELRGDTDTWQSAPWLNGNDKLFGGAGDDTLYGGLGDDDLRGGSGSDTAVFDEDFADLAIERIAGGFRVTAASGIDLMSGVEHIKAADGTYSWNVATRLWEPDSII